MKFIEFNIMDFYKIIIHISPKKKQDIKKIAPLVYRANLDLQNPV